MIDITEIKGLQEGDIFYLPDEEEHGWVFLGWGKKGFFWKYLNRPDDTVTESQDPKMDVTGYVVLVGYRNRQKIKKALGL